MSKDLIYSNLPVIPLRGAVFFPGMSFQFDIGRTISLNAVEKALKHSTKIFIVTQDDPKIDEPNISQLHKIGVICEIRNIKKHNNSKILEIVVDALSRGEIISGDDSGSYIKCDVEEIIENDISYISTPVSDALIRKTRDALVEYSKVNPYYPLEMFNDVFDTKNPAVISDFIAKDIITDIDDRLELLDETIGIIRLEKLYTFLKKEVEICSCENRIEAIVNERMEKNNREYYLKEKMHAIAIELGDEEDPYEEQAAYNEKINALDCPDTVKEKLLYECSRLFKMQQSSPDATVLRGYLDTALSIPFGTYTEDSYDLHNARNILDRDHYGMKKVKDRFIEMLAVKSRIKDIKGQIICLVGPPGVGKTSIVRSVAEAMGREYVRMSLGGVSDEAEIRGHRKTYVGAMVGRIASAVIQAKTMNPIILLDEIDKLGSNYKGDPASALLEVLDPEQNNTFRDNYLEFPLDLSKVLFVTTANDPSTIPGPLYDRMEIIELSSYTSEEKLMISKNHLIKKQMHLHGLNGNDLRINDKMLKSIIENYTKEAGVRRLEQIIASICRKSAVKLDFEACKRVTLNKEILKEFLGPEKYSTEDIPKGDLVGVVNGLAWTSVGGTLLPIEALVMPGNGNITLTGSLGDVMKESASIAISYIRSIANDFNIDLSDFKKYDIHIHAPEGAVPKDGPSAGVTMATAILSAFSGRYVDSTVAMTGEISLTGRVMKIGGLREKAMAAYNAGIKTVIIPKENEVDLWEIDKAVLEGLNFIGAESLDEVFSIAIKPEKKVPLDITFSETSVSKGG